MSSDQKVGFSIAHSHVSTNMWRLAISVPGRRRDNRLPVSATDTFRQAVREFATEQWRV
jgi:hypothetical protein